MARPSDWWLIGLGQDPVPGDPAGVRALMVGYADLADDFRTVATQLRSAVSDSTVTEWTGDAADSFRLCRTVLHNRSARGGWLRRAQNLS